MKHYYPVYQESTTRIPENIGYALRISGELSACLLREILNEGPCPDEMCEKKMSIFRHVWLIIPCGQRKVKIMTADDGEDVFISMETKDINFLLGTKVYI
jgi:hypothetical protein